MGAQQKFEAILKIFDFFPNTQFIRYQGEGDFKTATGGFFSIILITIFSVLFFSAGFKTVNYLDISTCEGHDLYFKFLSLWPKCILAYIQYYFEFIDDSIVRLVAATQDVVYQVTPQQSTLKTGPEGKFMFAISVYGLDLSNPNITYFDIRLTQYYYKPIGIPINITQIPLQVCTSSHFNFSSEILLDYSKYNASTWLCPKMDVDLVVMGSISSDMFAAVTISVSKCDSTIKNNCASDAFLDSFQSSQGLFTVAVVLINNLVHAFEPNNYISPYLEDRNYFSFTRTLGFKANAYIQDYQITTDQSLLPITSKVVQQGIYVPEMFKHYTNPIIDNNYANINFVKSNTKSIYTRSFKKIDEFLGYVGGLVGIAMSFLFFLGAYTEICFEISLASSLYSHNGKKINYSRFNLLHYFGYLVYQFGKICGIGQRWKIMKLYTNCKEQIGKQLDIAYMLKRFLFLERSVSLLFEDYQIDALYLQHKLDLQKAIDGRKMHQLQNAIRKRRVKKENEYFEYKKYSLRNASQKSEEESISTIKTDRIAILKNNVAKLFKDPKNKDINQKILMHCDRSLLSFFDSDGSKQIMDENQFKKFTGEKYFREMQQLQIQKLKRVNWQRELFKHSSEDGL